MKFPISLSVTSANPDSDLPETKLCFLYVTECHKHVSCLLYHFNSSPPLLWLHAFFIISVSLLFSTIPLYVLFPGMSMLISVCLLLLCSRKNKRRHSQKMQIREGGQPEHEYTRGFPGFIHVICNIFILFFIIE